MKLLRRLVHLARVTASGVSFTSFGLGGVVLALIVLPLVRWRHRAAPPFERAKACQRWVQRSFALLHRFMRVTRLIDFDPARVDAQMPPGGFVMVANHPTLVDITAMASVYGLMTCVAKTPIFRAPIIGAIVRSCAYIDGGAGDVFAGARVVAQALERLEAGMPVAIFPEGTRSPVGGLHPFKRGAFEIACRANVPVLPIFITCEPATLSKSQRWYDIPARFADFRLTPQPLMRPEDYGQNAARMAAAAEELFRREMNLTRERAANE